MSFDSLPDFPGWSAPVSDSFLARHSSNNLLSLRSFHLCETSGRLVLWCCDTTGKLTILSTCCTREISMVFWASESRQQPCGSSGPVSLGGPCLSLGMDSSTRLLDLRSLDRRCIIWIVGTWCCGTAGKSTPPSKRGASCEPS